MRINNENQLLITLQDWQMAGLSYDQYRWQFRNNQLEATRACKGKPAEIIFDSIPAQYKLKITQVLGDPRQNAVHRSFRDMVEADEKAIEYYSTYLLSDGRNLSADHIREYIANANILNAVATMFKTQSQARKALGGNMTGFWAKALNAVETVKGEFQHTLPGNEVAFKRKYQRYIDKGYEGIISGKFCNDNSRKVSADIERLIMSMYIMDNKPFSTDVHILYKLFLASSIQVVDKKTGELFRPEDFIKNGAPIEISETTVWNYLNQPHNRVIVDSKRSGAFNFNNEHRPHHLRKSPDYSFSKISMDDRDLPRKLVDGKRVKAYYAYDVATGCVIGRAYSRDKDEALFKNCMRDMLQLIRKENLPMPVEVEVENHLVNKFFDDLALMFSIVRICNPGNSQEKTAEHLNRAKKYQIEKKTHTGIGRWNLSEAYRVDNDKINDEFVEKGYTFERLVADDIQDCINFNNSFDKKHAKKYPGKTRWQVFMETLNPNAPRVQEAIAYKSFGEMTHTSIKRSKYITVKNNEYELPGPHILKRLLPNNYEVKAYYLSDTDGTIREVFLYQNDVFLCKCNQVDKYNRAKGEWVDGQDTVAYEKQAIYNSQFDKLTKEGRNELATVSIIETEVIQAAIAAEPTIVEENPLKDDDIDDMLNDYNPNDYLGIDNI